VDFIVSEVLKCNQESIRNGSMGAIIASTYNHLLYFCFIMSAVYFWYLVDLVDLIFQC